MFFISTDGQEKSAAGIKWSVAATLPVAKDAAKQLGLAGAVGGVHNNVLIVAGGANFPDSLPWEGGTKRYWDDVYILERDEKGSYTWFAKTFKLPAAVAYGASVSTPQGVLVLGGENENGILSQSFLMQWNAVTKELNVTPFIPLPLSLTNASATLIGNTVYIAGGETTGRATSSFYSIDLSNARSWKELPPLPVSLSHSVAVTQSNGEYPCVFVIGGRAQSPDGISKLFNSTFRFDPRKNTWHQLAPIGNRGDTTTLSAATAVATGANYILVMGGDKGNIFTRIEQYNAAIARENDPVAKQQLQAAKKELLNGHEGFSRDMYLYNTITNAWTLAGALPASPVTTFAIKWGDDILIPSGEVKPGIRTPDILKGGLASKEYFSWIDYLVVFVYLGLMIGIGLWTSKNQGTTDDYFRGGQRIPGWAAGLSIYGTQLSAITFMSITAKTYAANWNYFFLQMTILMVIPIITRYFIPFYRKLEITSAYEYLEKRFNYLSRALASLLYIMLQVGRLAIVLLLPSLALTLVTGIDVNICILLMGIITIFYTLKGGIEAVVWTDVVQVIILLGGALSCLVMIPFMLDESPASLWQTLQQEEKLDLFNTSLSFNEPTLWVVLLGGIAINVITYGADQSVVQKYLTTKDEAASKKSLRLGAWMSLPSALTFFSIGTLLYLFYKHNPDKVNYQLASADAIFPWFIVTELPNGVTGLLIAAIFAAAMSTLSSSMNSVTTALITDFYRRARPERTEQSYLKTAKLFTLTVGIIGTSLALIMARWGISSLWDQFNTILGLFTGGLGGLFVLGIFTRKANAKGAVAGLIVSGFVQFYISQFTNINLLMYAFTGLVACVFFGYIFSLVFGAQQKNIEGLTVYK